MPVSTLSAAVNITPTVIKTFLEHSKRKGHKLKHHEELPDLATDDLIFDEAFHIVKAFILLGTKNTVESLQSFTNTHVPSPYWAAVSPVRIPLSTANRAADVLIDWFGPEDLKTIVGGDRWWQVRGLDGIDAEWITEREYLSPAKPAEKGSKMSESDKDILRMEELETVMLYVHGGGYFWGSINTHRYQILRYARKIKGRAFAVNYRKAPQYPWPCPLQDVLAAYLYLIEPPPGALHKAIPPSKIVFAGDSAGGGLSITVLTVIRDMGLPLPAGAVLISPWVDLTHSFPSIMTNTETDIIPAHGFLSKPSTLWPVKPVDDERVVRTTSNSPPNPGHADTLRPSSERLEKERIKTGAFEKDRQADVTSQKEMLDDTKNVSPGNISAEEKSSSNGNGNGNQKANIESDLPDLHDIDFWQPKPPKVLMDNPRDVPWEMRSQIHMYAETEQLSHPLVSPVLQGSLGNLCPLYIIAGDGEVLRDEVIYLAHRAAHPEDMPVREGVLRDGRRQRENVEKFKKPTKVHLQVYDGMCHVLTVFTFTESAKYAYRSIAEFVKHVTNNSEEHLDRNPFPELHRPPSEISTSSEPDDEGRRETAYNVKAMLGAKSIPSPSISHIGSQKSDVKLYKENESNVAKQIKADETEQMPGKNLESIDIDETQKDIPDVRMIRERVDIHGIVRVMEPKEEVSALQVRPQEVGLIKEGPLNKWWSGQKEWDKRYRRNGEKAIKKRRKYEERAKKVMENAREQGLLLVHENQNHSSPRPTRITSNMSTLSTKSARRIDNDRRWGPLDLEYENVPSSAIANRRDTPEALALLKKSIYYSAPATHQTVPKMNTADIIRAAFDPDDDPRTHPKQSVSEQQVRANIIPGLHGLKMWDSIVRLFMRESSKRARKGKMALQETSEKLKNASSFGSSGKGNKITELTNDSK